MLTHSSLQMYMMHVHIHDLSQVFHDAIVATRKLGLQYLWIDALCILQDDTDDWQHEGSRMGNYYRNAFIVLSSLSSSEGRHGFLREREHWSAVHLGGGFSDRKCLAFGVHFVYVNKIQYL